MPNGKRTRRARARRERARREMPSCAEWMWREIAPFFRRPPMAASRSARHLRNAGIETLEAMRDLLDEAIVWLRSQERRPPEMRRIRVQD
jgi:hypothetical protein